MEAQANGPDVNINIVEDQHDGEEFPMASMAPGEEANAEQKQRDRRNLRAAFLKKFQNRVDGDSAPADGESKGNEKESGPAGEEEKEKPSSPHNEPVREEKERAASSRSRSAQKSAKNDGERRQPSARSASGRSGAKRAAAAEEEPPQEPNKKAWTDDFGNSEV